MKKRIAFVAAMMLPLSAWAASVADTHTDMAGCEACHQDGAPSSDMAYENQTCIDCHGGLADLTQIHVDHDGMLECTDCHITHDADDDASSTCADCH
ncbi:cytochrome c3 family protein [Ferrimonas marina]|uniref:Cytochrome c3 n=1 Tax=Ferrimonas marina TaxID=299255 RepID=A0A1M5X4H1_9GAMM|nr:cytochrome c3 family protein [Ferrimonas marina]SHH94701.1 Cytochrome c3 [Ferrimonas marina]